jgi:N-acetylglutamate synthase-like GNAT family acetyltransferase
MYVRDAKNREEAWLLDWIEEFGLDDASFRSRDYVVAVDETDGETAGFGRIRIHAAGDSRHCELTSIGVLPAWREQGVGAHVVERLVEYAGDERLDRAYALTGQGGYLTQFGFRRTDRERLPPVLSERLDTIREETASDAVPLVLSLDRFRMPERLRERFKTAQSRPTEQTDDLQEGPEDFGIDPEQASYKYDV